MAYVRAKAIKYPLRSLMDYIADVKNNFDKISPHDDVISAMFDENTKHTDDEKLFIYCDHCTYETAHIEWARTIKQSHYDLNGSSREHLGYHVIQSFKPGEVTAEQAHEIGKDYAAKLFGGRYQYIVTTHIDKDHYHNHIAVCSVSYTDHKKLNYKYYNTGQPTLQEWRKISDEICQAHGLDTMRLDEKQNGRNKDTRDRPQRKNNRDVIRADIDKVIADADSYEEFLEKMSDMGYKFKFGKNTALKKDGMKNFIYLNSLGTDYREEDIKERIITKRPVIPKRMRNGKIKITLIIDMEKNIKVQQSKGYENWAKIHNLQEASKTLNFLIENNITTYEAMDKKVSDLQKDKIQTQEKLNALDKQIHDAKSQSELLSRYNSIKKYAAAYNSSSNKKRYRADHWNELQEFEALNHKMKSLYPDGKLPNENKLHSELEELIKQREETYKQYTAADDEIDTYTAAKHNVDIFMKRDSNNTEQDHNNEEHSQAMQHTPSKDRQNEYTI